MRQMDSYSAIALLLQNPFDGTPLPEWLGAMEVILNLVYAFAVNGYLILILLGFMIYTTGLYDGISKTLVIIGIALYIVGPTIATPLLVRQALVSFLSKLLLLLGTVYLASMRQS